MKDNVPKFYTLCPTKAEAVVDKKGALTEKRRDEKVGYIN